jgi:FkbM family methyltransferase
MYSISHNTIKAFTFLLKQTDGFWNYYKLLTTLIVSKISISKEVVNAVDIKFKNFYLRFLPGQGELTPLEEIKLLSEKLFLMESISNWVVIDCGANIGLFSLALKDAKLIVAIEPSPDTYSRLTYNFEKNDINGITLNNAVSSKEGELAMTINENSSVLSQVSKDGNFIVKALTLDRICTEHNLQVVDLLKLDVEDHEIEALIGAEKLLSSNSIKRIFFEYRTQAALKEIETYLSKFGYSRTFISSLDCGNGLWSLNSI